MGTQKHQNDLFAEPRFRTLDSLIGSDGKPAIIIIGCGRTKRRTAAPAHLLYQSDRFKSACAAAEALGANYFILSGRHGLVRPDQIVEPYDLDLSRCDVRQKESWRDKVASQLLGLKGPARVCFLTTTAYSSLLSSAPALADSMLTMTLPLAAIDERFHGVWHRQALADSMRYRDLIRLYEIIDDARKLGATFLLGSLGEQKLPKRGVYIFLDPQEPNFAGTSPRIVRIGTHAVSAGSKSILRSRLRNHLGLADKSGNHRGSIFRLHVGRAMLRKDNGVGIGESWGKGQDAPPDIRAAERIHEIRVSEYLRKLEVFILEIDDVASKLSLRAVVERQLIALCSEALQPIDRATPGWLGHCSPMAAIVGSGLWNLRDVGSEYNPTGKGSVAEICSWSKKINEHS